MSFLSRYRDGEHEDVWGELSEVPLSKLVGDALDDARAVAMETMHRVRKNALRLTTNLASVGYEVAGGTSEVVERDEQPVGAPIPSIELEVFARRAGPFPLSISTFWEVVGHLNFIGLPPLSSVLDWPALEELDALQVFSPSHGDPKFMFGAIVITLDPVLKAGYGGVGPIVLPRVASVDAPLNFEDSPVFFDDGPPLMLVSYLREAFRRGGFFGLEPEVHGDLIARLRDGFLEF